MRTSELKDMAPEFKVKNDGWKSRWYNWAVVIVLAIAIIAEAAPSDKTRYVLEKTPGIGGILKDFGVLKPKP